MVGQAKREKLIIIRAADHGLKWIFCLTTIMNMYSSSSSLVFKGLNAKEEKKGQENEKKEAFKEQLRPSESSLESRQGQKVWNKWNAVVGKFAVLPNLLKNIN